MFGDRLKAARIEAGHTQQSLGELINVEPKQIWRWETDKNTPDAYTIAKLAEALNISADYLVGLTDNPTPHNLDMDALSTQEREVISAWRRGNKLAAIKALVD